MGRTLYHTCAICGANLDPGEPCDCREEKERERKKMQNRFRVGKNGQMQMCFMQEVKDAKV